MGDVTPDEPKDDVANALPGKRGTKRLIFGGVLLLVIIMLAVGWMQRREIADSYVQDYLAENNVKASYQLEDVGLRTQRLTDLVIGDPDNPDLTIKSLEIDISLDTSGASLQWVRASGVRLRGKILEDGQLRFGEVDKFRDLDSKEPFAFPDLALDLEDARISLATPWGPVGASMSGYGHFYGRFNGEAALDAQQLKIAGCEADKVRLSGDIAIISQKPKLTGPLSAEKLVCSDQQILARNVNLDSDVQLNDVFDRWIGVADFKATDIKIAGQNIVQPSGRTEFEGGMKRTTFRLNLQEAGYQDKLLRIRQIALDAEGRFGLEDGFSLAMRGDAEVIGGKAGQDITASLTGLGNSTAGTPVAPLVRRLAPALRDALGNFDAGLKFDFAIPVQAASKIDVQAFDIASASGAKLAQTGTLRLESGGDGWALVTPVRFSMSGGNLPSANLSIRRAGRNWSGSLALSPYAAGNARIALQKLDFAGRPGGSWNFTGNGSLSGPLYGGWIDGLRFPLNGAWNGKALSLYNSCQDITFDRLRYSGLDLGKQNVRLCPQGRAVLTNGANGTQIAAKLPNLAVKGALSGSRFSLSSTVVDFTLDRDFRASNVSFSVGTADAQTAFNLGELNGRFVSSGIAGEIANGEGKIANVPILFNDAEGQWTFSDGKLRLVTGLTFTDEAQVGRYKPMSAPEVLIDYENGVITAIGDIFEPTTLTKVADVDIRHQFADSAGRALFSVDDLAFTKRFQPEKITPLTLGVIANADGKVYGDGRIEWDNSNDGIRSGGTFGTKGIDLAAAFGPVKGLQTELKFTDLLNLETAPGQVATLVSVNPGIEALDGRVRYQLLADQKVKIEGGSWPFAGGELLLDETIWDFSEEKPRDLVFRVRGVEVARFLEQFDFENLAATGVFDGVLPMRFDQDGGRIIGGELIAREGGGSVAYVGELTYQDMGAYANFAFQALRSLEYDGMRVELVGSLEGEIITVVKFTGIRQGSGAKRNFITRQLAEIPIEFNITIQAQFFQLMSSVRSLYDAEYLVQRNLPDLVRQQQAAAEQLAQDSVNENEQKNEQSVQKSESGDPL